MTKILMVCLGNICRSPLAHGILESKLPKDRFYIDSAGTADYHVGLHPDYRSIEIARTEGQIDISGQKARQFTSNDFEDFDLIYVMDHSNYDTVIQMAKTSEEKSKVKLILAEKSTNFNRNVPDPYYGTREDFHHVYLLLNEITDIIAKNLLK